MGLAGVDYGAFNGSGFLTGGGPSGYGVPASPIMAVPSHRTYPIRSDYEDEDLWMVAMTRYCFQKSWQLFQYRLAANREAISLHTSNTEFSKFPGYSRTPDGAVATPVEQEFVNTLTPIINTKLGEFVSRGFAINVDVSSIESKSRMNDFMGSLMLFDYLKDLEGEVGEMAREGLPPNAPQILEEYKGDVEMYMKRGYRDMLQIAMQRMLEDWMERIDFESWLAQAYKLYLITDMAIACPRVNEDSLDVELPLIHTDRFMPDLSVLDNHFTNAKYFIEYEYLPLESIMMKYPHLNIDDVKRFLGARSQFVGLPVYTLLNGRAYIIVVRCQFIYPEEIIIRTQTTDEPQTELEVDSEGNVKQALVEMESMYKETRTRYEELYTCDLIGGSLVAKKARTPYQLRSRNAPAKVNLGSRVLVYDYFLSPTAPNTSAKIRVLLKYRNAALFKLAEYVGQIQGGYLEIDERLIPHGPEGMSEETAFRTWLENMRQNRIIFVNRANADIVGDGQVVKAVNINTNNNEINLLMEVVNYYDKEINRFMNFNEARTGQSGQYTTAQVGKANLSQSDFGTSDQVKSFERFLQSVLTDVANLLKLCIVKKKELADKGDPIAQQSYEFDKMKYGDIFASIVTDITLEDIGIAIKRKENEDELKQEYKQLFQLALQQQGNLDILEAIVYGYDATTSSEMKDKLLDMIRLLKQEQMQQQQAQMAQQQAQAQASQQMNNEAQAQSKEQGANLDIRNKLAELMAQQQMQQGQPK